MAKKKSSAQVFVTDGVGGLVPAEDHRFDEGAWSGVFEIPPAQADLWMEYLQAECSDRGWSCTFFGQMSAEENSGSISVHTGIAGQSPQVAIVWERPRSGPLCLRVRSTSQPPLPDDEVTTFIGRVNERFQTGAKQAFYQRGYLHYEGLPWRGELWLHDGVRLGPPARHADWLIAPQVIVVDGVVHAVGWQGAHGLFVSKLEELSLFLTIIMRSNIGVPKDGHVWTIDGGKPQSELRQLGYVEENVPSEMPKRGQCSSVPLRQIARPDFALHGITAEDHEQWLPADIHDLWRQYIDLPPDRRDQFQRVARTYQMANLLWRDYRTASLALRVVACEALKPPGRRYNHLNIYHVVEGLLGATYSDQLRRLRFAPQRIRSAHLHRGELLGAEGIHRMMMSTFWDPTFDEDYRVVARVAHAAIVEWLRSGGTFAASAARKRRRRRRR